MKGTSVVVLLGLAVIINCIGDMYRSRRIARLEKQVEVLTKALEKEKNE